MNAPTKATNTGVKLRRRLNVIARISFLCFHDPGSRIANAMAQRRPAKMRGGISRRPCLINTHEVAQRNVTRRAGKMARLCGDKRTVAPLSRGNAALLSACSDEEAQHHVVH